ncbi:MAG: hypothetical protein ACI94Y_001680 [Maribacter sp.]|jgi:hypothetical protein
MKFFVISILIYFGYRTFVRPFLQLKNRDVDDNVEIIDDADYIDYEEVD